VENRDALAYWLDVKECAQRQLEVAEKNIGRLVMEHLLENSNVQEKDN
jgi:hypothetical protein